MSLYELTKQAIERVRLHRGNADIAEWLSEIEPVLLARWGYGIGKGKVDSVWIYKGFLEIYATYSSALHGLNSSKIDIDIDIIKADNPLIEANKVRLSRELYESGERIGALDKQLKDEMARFQELTNELKGFTKWA